MCRDDQRPCARCRAYGDLVSAVAGLQRAYGAAVAKAVGHAVSEVVEVEEAAVVGAGKAKVVLEQKVRGLIFPGASKE